MGFTLPTSGLTEAVEAPVTFQLKTEMLPGETRLGVAVKEFIVGDNEGDGVPVLLPTIT
jgi:hypothetical protein